MKPPSGGWYLNAPGERGQFFSRAFACVALSIAAAALLTGCGGNSEKESARTLLGEAGSTTVREAAAGDMTRICPERDPSNVDAKVTNNLDIPVQMWFSGIDCVQWGGKTSAYYSGAILVPGATLKMSMTAWSQGIPQWNTTIRTQNGQTNLASFGQRIATMSWGSLVKIVNVNEVAISGAGRPASARMDPDELSNTLVLSYTE